MISKYVISKSYSSNILYRETQTENGDYPIIVV